jgi:hypothetical protein
MKHKAKIILVVFILFVLAAGCGQKRPDIGNGYQIVYSPRGSYLAILNPNNSVIIHDHVLDFAFDSVYIIAVQRPFDSVPECTQPESKYSDCKRAILKTSTFKQYWIIDKTKESVFVTADRKHTNAYGPFNKEQYLLKRKKLNLPDSLVIKSSIR